MFVTVYGVSFFLALDRLEDGRWRASSRDWHGLEVTADTPHSAARQWAGAFENEVDQLIGQRRRRRELLANLRMTHVVRPSYALPNPLD